MEEFKFDYQWKSKNNRWQADMYIDKNKMYGAIMSNTLENSKYSEQVGFHIEKITNNYYSNQFDGSLPKYVKNEIIEFVKSKM